MFVAVHLHSGTAKCPKLETHVVGKFDKENF